MNAIQDTSFVEYVTKLVLEEMQSKGVKIQKNKIPVNISARHLHLCKTDMEALFGKDKELTVVKYISQPGQFAAEERVTLVGPKGKLENVRVLGPLRKETQIEVSVTDARNLGIQPIIRESGNVEGTPGLTLIGPKGTVTLQKGCIVPERHIHMTPQDAVQFGVKDGQRVSVRAENPRGGILEHVVIRVREDFALDMHIDTDEANALGISGGDQLEILDRGGEK